MNFRQKEETIIKTMAERNYDMFDGNKNEALDFLGAQLESFPRYANSVIRMEQMQPILYARYEGQELRDRVTDMDKNRRIAHEAAISSLNVLNRFSKNLGLEPFADIDTTDRYKVADFVGQYCNEVYLNRSGGDMYQATKDRTEDFDTKKHADRMQELTNKYSGVLNQSENSGAEMTL